MFLDWLFPKMKGGGGGQRLFGKIVSFGTTSRVNVIILIQDGFFCWFSPKDVGGGKIPPKKLKVKVQQGENVKPELSLFWKGFCQRQHF